MLARLRKFLQVGGDLPTLNCYGQDEKLLLSNAGIRQL